MLKLLEKLVLICIRVARTYSLLQSLDVLESVFASTTGPVSYIAVPSSLAREPKSSSTLSERLRTLFVPPEGRAASGMNFCGHMTTQRSSFRREPPSHSHSQRSSGATSPPCQQPSSRYPSRCRQCPSADSALPQIPSISVVCVCVFSSHSFWTSSSLDVPAGVTQEEGHTGFLIHLLSAVRALIFLARRIQPFLSLVDREVEFCVLTI